MNTKNNIQTVLDKLNREFLGTVIHINGRDELDEHYCPGEQEMLNLQVPRPEV